MSLPPEAIAYQTAHINENRAPVLLAANSVLTALATVAIFLRFLIRWKTKVGVKADDYTILLAGVYVAHVAMGNSRVNTLHRSWLGFRWLSIITVSFSDRPQPISLQPLMKQRREMASESMSLLSQMRNFQDFSRWVHQSLINIKHCG